MNFFKNEFVLIYFVDYEMVKILLPNTKIDTNDYWNRTN